MSSPVWIVIDEHPKGDSLGSLSSSEQFSLASNESLKNSTIRGAFCVHPRNDNSKHV